MLQNKSAAMTSMIRYPRQLPNVFRQGRIIPSSTSRAIHVPGGVDGHGARRAARVRHGQRGRGGRGGIRVERERPDRRAEGDSRPILLQIVRGHRLARVDRAVVVRVVVNRIRVRIGEIDDVSISAE